jgi:hypothetical protein
MVSITTNISTVLPGVSPPARSGNVAFLRPDATVGARTPRLTRSNILGVTGMSRYALAAMFRRDGLFGSDSDLTPAEQAAVLAALPELPGIKPAAFAADTTPRLAALAAYVSALAAGAPATGERQRLQSAGLAPAAIDEAAAVVGNVLVVFAPQH